MITKIAVHTNGKYTVFFNAKPNAWKPYSVVNTITDEIEFSYSALDVCLDYISDNT